MRYTVSKPKRHLSRKLLLSLVVLVVLIGAAAGIVRHLYFENLKPVSAVGKSGQLITVASGTSAEDIAKQLKEAGLIRSPWAFKLYVSSKNVREALEAGTYSFDPSQSVPEIVAQLTHGKVATDLVTIIPGQRLNQIRTTLINYGFKASDVDAALDPAQYAGNPALVDKPVAASLEGYVYPDSYQKNSGTLPQQIIEASLKEMGGKLTPELRAAFAQQGLSAYEALTLASIVEQEVSRQEDRAQAAQVFLKRLHSDMQLGSDVTAFYGSTVAGLKPSLLYDSPYNTRLHNGLPPTPISNVSVSSLTAVAHPANTDWLYFVAGDDGVTHFTRTLAEHEAAAAQYCHKLCSETD